MGFELSKDSAGRLTGWLAPLLVASAPLATILLSWSDPSLEPESGDRLVKTFALPVVCAELALILVALRVVPAHSVQPPADWIRAGLALFVLLACGTLLWAAPDPVTGAVWTVLHFIHLAFGFAIYRLCASRIVPIERLTNALIAGYVAATIALIVFILGIDDKTGFDWLNGLPGYDNIRRLGYYSAPILALCIGIAAADGGLRRRCAALAVLAIGCALIVWTGARGAMAALILASLVAMPFFRRLRLAALPIAAAASAGALAGALVPPLAPFMGSERMIRTEIPPEGSPPDHGLLSGRVELWQETVRAIGERPVFGHGEAQIHELSEVVAAMYTLHPHNLLLQSLLAWGVAGTILLRPWPGLCCAPSSRQREPMGGITLPTASRPPCC